LRTNFLTDKEKSKKEKGSNQFDLVGGKDGKRGFKVSRNGIGNEGNKTKNVHGRGVKGHASWGKGFRGNPP